MRSEKPWVMWKDSVKTKGLHKLKMGQFEINADLSDNR